MLLNYQSYKFCPSFFFFLFLLMWKYLCANASMLKVKVKLKELAIFLGDTSCSNDLQRVKEQMRRELKSVGHRKTWRTFLPFINFPWWRFGASSTVREQRSALLPSKKTHKTETSPQIYAAAVINILKKRVYSLMEHKKESSFTAAKNNN